jgi:hypothetical protein
MNLNHNEEMAHIKIKRWIQFNLKSKLSKNLIPNNSNEIVSQVVHLQEKILRYDKSNQEETIQLW